MTQEVVVVSGLPRSGTSLMMQMLAAAGLPVLTDNVRAPDVHNPRGYFEWEPVKRLARFPSLISQAAGKCVKVVSFHLFSLPEGFDYRVIFMERDLNEVTLSQCEMIAKLGAAQPVPREDAVMRALSMHCDQVNAWLTSRKEILVLRVQHAGLMTDTISETKRVAAFLGLDQSSGDAMAKHVDRSLWRSHAICETIASNPKEEF